MNKTPIYKESYLYAYEHGEDAQYIASRNAITSEKQSRKKMQKVVK